MKLRFIWVVPPNVLFFLSKCCQTDYRQINLIFDGKLYFEQGFDIYLYRVFDARKGRVTEFQIQTRLWTGCFKEFQIYAFLVMNKIRIGVVTQCKRELHLMYSNLSNPIVVVLFPCRNHHCSILSPFAKSLEHVQSVYVQCQHDKFQITAGITVEIMRKLSL